MNTYRNQLRADEAQIEKEVEDMTGEAKYPTVAGRTSALAHHYAGVADFEAAQRQRIGRDPKALISVFTGQVGGPSAGDFAILLQELHVYLRLRPELEDADFHVEHAAAEMQAAADREVQRREEDLDAPAAAASDEAYDRKVDAGLIGRSDFMPEVVKA